MLTQERMIQSFGICCSSIDSKQRGYSIVSEKFERIANSLACVVRALQDVECLLSHDPWHCDNWSASS